jgi:hypothetical protein
MPIEPTPFEQVLVVAVATKLTGELTVAPFFGLVTETLARAGAANDKNTQTAAWTVFITPPSGMYLWTCGNCM